MSISKTIEIVLRHFNEKQMSVATMHVYSIELSTGYPLNEL